jgi:hypothetical protein
MRTISESAQRKGEERMNVETETHETRWYETDFMRGLQETCDVVLTALCHEAMAKGFVQPFEIEFFDDRSSFAEFTVDENDSESRWGYPIRHNQEVEAPLWAVLKSRDRLTLRRDFALE